MLDEINNLTIKAKITELIIGIYRLLNQNLRDIILKLIV
jgi:hypothetical protein